MIIRPPYARRAVTEAVLTAPGRWHRSLWWDLLLECGHRKEEWWRASEGPRTWVRCYDCGRENRRTGE